MPTIMIVTKEREGHGQSKWWSTGILFVQQKGANNIKASVYVEVEKEKYEFKRLWKVFCCKK